MSLQVWLPLNVSLENLGLGDVGEIDTTNISFIDNGKIGKCLTGYTGYFNVSSMASKKQMSVAYWIKINTVTSTKWLDVFRWYSTDGSTTYASRNEFYNDCTTTGFWFKGGSISGKTTTVGDWHHHAFTIDYEAGTAEFYIDGVSVGSSSAVDTTHYLTGTNFMIGESGLDTSHNDVRLYDHCLSAKEVKELSKGLVAHYPLNDFIGNPNLLPMDHGVNNVNTRTNYYLGGTSNSIYHQLDAGTYTISVSFQNCEAYPNVYYLKRNGSNINLGNARTSKTFELIESGEYRFWLFANPNSMSGIEDDQVVNFKLEKGSIATPWVPNIQDDLYSAMGLDENIIYDCSGYGYNGENTGCSVNPNSARYHVSTAFDGTSYITLHNDSFPVILSNDFTLSMWIYSDDDEDRSLWFGNYGISGGGNFFGFEKTASNGVRFWWNKGGPDKNFATYITKSDGWVLLTLVKEGNVAKIYKNGVLSATNTSDLYVSANLPSTATTFRLGADGRITGNTLFKGSMSDVRIYATALSAEDIKELHETSVSIDDKGNFHAYEISEV